MLEMFKGVANSPETTITNNISNLDTIIYVLDETRVPTELPNLMVLGTGSGAETIKVVSVDGNAITVERGFQGVAKAWNAGTIIARNFTEYDYNALLENIKEKDLEIEALQLEVDEHKAETTQQLIISSRDSTLVGSQVITGFNKIPKSLIIWSYIPLTSKHSIGFITPINQAVSAIDEVGKTDGLLAGVLISNDSGNRVSGVVTINDDNTITISWSKIGTMTGIIDLFIFANYHD